MVRVFDELFEILQLIGFGGIRFSSWNPFVVFLVIVAIMGICNLFYKGATKSKNSVKESSSPSKTANFKQNPPQKPQPAQFKKSSSTQNMNVKKNCCPKCGTEASDDEKMESEKFCWSCGATWE